MDEGTRFRLCAEQALEESRALFFDTIYRFYRVYGGDLDELISDSFLCFLNAFASYDAAKAEFGTWLVYRLQKDLLETRREAARTAAVRRKHMVVTSFDVYSCPDRPSRTFNPDEFCERLSPVAAEAVRTCLNMPRDLLRAADERGGTPRNFRYVLRQWLIQSGHATAAVTGAFAEIQGAL